MAAQRVMLTLAAASGLIAVAAAAWAAHGMSDPTMRDLVRTASGMEMNHALAVFAAVFVARLGGRGGLIAAGLFLAGALFFCGSVYAVALAAPRAVSWGAPLGGFTFMAGWLVLAWTCLRLKPNDNPFSPESP